MSSKEVADLVLRVLDGTEELHVVAGVVRDGGGAVTNHGNSRRTTSSAFAALAGFSTEVVQDIVGAFLAASTGILVTYNDAGNVETIAVDAATAAQVRAGVAGKVVTADVLQAAMAPQALVDSATIAWDMSTAINAKVTLGASGHALAVSNPVAGATYSLGVAQDGTGGRTIIWPASFDWGATGVPVLSTAASKRDRITLFCTDAATPKFDAFLSGKGFS